MRRTWTCPVRTPREKMGPGTARAAPGQDRGRTRRWLGRSAPPPRVGGGRETPVSGPAKGDSNRVIPGTRRNGALVAGLAGAGAPGPTREDCGSAGHDDGALFHRAHPSLEHGTRDTSVEERPLAGSLSWAPSPSARGSSARTSSAAAPPITNGHLIGLIEGASASRRCYTRGRASSSNGWTNGGRVSGLGGPRRPRLSER